jgi:hypothetical protein
MRMEFWRGIGASVLVALPLAEETEDAYEGRLEETKPLTGRSQAV